MVSPEEALAHAWTPEEEVLRRANRARLFVGTPEKVHDRLAGLAARVSADELMVMTAVFDQSAKLRSYELLAGAFGLAAPATS